MEFTFKFQGNEFFGFEIGSSDVSAIHCGLHDGKPSITRINADTSGAFFRALASGKQLFGVVNRIASSCICD